MRKHLLILKEEVNAAPFIKRFRETCHVHYLGRFLLVLFISFFALFVTQWGQATGAVKGQSARPDKQMNDNPPLISDVMTKEELTAYLEEKRISTIGKEEFKGLELLWENTFDVPIEQASDVTEKGNSIILSYSNESLQKAILFIDPKGKVRRNVGFKDIKNTKTENRRVEHLLRVAMSGKYAGVYKIERDKKTATFTYFGEEGKLLWTQIVSKQQWPDDYVTAISYDGEVIVTAEGNPNWSVEGEKVGVNLNVNKLRFYGAKGNLLSEYGGFRNISIGKLSDDGRYYAAIMWWSRGMDRSENRLVYIRTKDGKVLWKTPFPGYWNIDIGDEKDLAISEKGSYVAAVKFSDEGRLEAEVYVFDRTGKAIARVKASLVWTISEDGVLGILNIVDVVKRKILGIKFDLNHFLPLDKGILQRFLLVSGDMIWTGDEGWFYYSRNCGCIKIRTSAVNNQWKLKMLKLSITERGK